MTDPNAPGDHEAVPTEETRAVEAGTVTYLSAEVGAEEAFIPLAVRRGLYLLALAGSVAAPVLAVYQTELATAVTTSAGVLNVAALGVALANPKK